MMLIVYGSYLFFQLKSHAEIYNAPSQKAPKRKRSKDKTGEMNKGVAQMAVGPAAALGGEGFHNPEAWVGHPDDVEDNDEPEEPRLSVIGAVFTLCAATALIGINAEFMVSGIAAIVKMSNISPEFIGLILIPIVGNAAEHATAVTVAIKDKMDLAIGVAVGSSMQIALFVLPFVVIVAWIAGIDQMTLEFDGFLIALLFGSYSLSGFIQTNFNSRRPPCQLPNRRRQLTLARRSHAHGNVHNYRRGRLLLPCQSRRCWLSISECMHYRALNLGMFDKEGSGHTFCSSLWMSKPAFRTTSSARHVSGHYQRIFQKFSSICNHLVVVIVRNLRSITTLFAAINQRHRVTHNAGSEDILSYRIRHVFRSTAGGTG